jgi:S-adenosylmethionine-diacylgycerolhomoserine-N-methlytransferase
MATTLASRHVGAPSPTVTMDRIYRHQRHVYDLTRPLFLFGRDALLHRMDVRAGDSVLEVGCGTARNLLKLQRLRRSVRLYGLDASQEMLATARWNVRRRGLEDRVELKHGLAEELCHARTFGLRERFDVIFFSYSLSMIPACVQALDAALASLRPGRSLYVVDFGDQRALPSWCRRPLQSWLSLFGVAHRPELYAHLAALAAAGCGELRSESFGLRYATQTEFSTR